MGDESLREIEWWDKKRLADLERLDEELGRQIRDLAWQRRKELPETYKPVHKTIIMFDFMKRARTNILNFIKVLVIPELVEDIGNNVFDEMIREGDVWERTDGGLSRRYQNNKRRTRWKN